jgi:hypothetical protein
MTVPYLQAHSNRFRSLAAEPTKRPLDLIVIHVMEAGETAKTAENVANWFHSEAEPRTSAHFCVDNDSCIQCLQLRDVAFAAPGANRNGVHIELAGYAKQGKAEWLDAYGKQMLPRAATLLAQYVIPKMETLAGIPFPVRYVDAEGLKRGERGITTHNEVTKAFRLSDHHDPGPGFPIAEFIEMVKKAGV